MDLNKTFEESGDERSSFVDFSEETLVEEHTTLIVASNENSLEENKSAPSYMKKTKACCKMMEAGSIAKKKTGSLYFGGKCSYTTSVDMSCSCVVYIGIILSLCLSLGTLNDLAF